ncbi:hypothetical protein H8D30_04995 [bacterium]|nr:hypothetical protein [bacterium]
MSVVEVFVYGDEIDPQLPQKVIDLVGDSHEVVVWDITLSDLGGLRRSRELSVSSFPAVYVDEKKVAGCSSGLWSPIALERALKEKETE